MHFTLVQMDSGPPFILIQVGTGQNEFSGLKPAAAAVPGGSSHPAFPPSLKITSNVSAVSIFNWQVNCQCTCVEFLRGLMQEYCFPEAQI